MRLLTQRQWLRIALYKRDWGAGLATQQPIRHATEDAKERRQGTVTPPHMGIKFRSA